MKNRLKKKKKSLKIYEKLCDGEVLVPCYFGAGTSNLAGTMMPSDKPFSVPTKNLQVINR